MDFGNNNRAGASRVGAKGGRVIELAVCFIHTTCKCNQHATREGIEHTPTFWLLVICGENRDCWVLIIFLLCLSSVVIAFIFSFCFCCSASSFSRSTSAAVSLSSAVRRLRVRKSWQWRSHSTDNWARRKSFIKVKSMGLWHRWHCSASRLQKVTVLMCSWRTSTSSWLTTWSMSTAWIRRQSTFSLRGRNLKGRPAEIPLEGVMPGAETDWPFPECWLSGEFRRDGIPADEWVPWPSLE